MNKLISPQHAKYYSRYRKYYNAGRRYNKYNYGRQTYPRYQPRYQSTQQQIHHVVQSTLGATVGSSATLPVTGVMVFRLNDVPGYTNYQSNWEFYKIRGVQVTFTPKINQVVQPNDLPTPIVSMSSAPTFHYHLSQRNDQAPTSLSQLVSYQSYQRFSTASSRPHRTSYWTPKVATSVYESAVTTGYSMLPTSQWISTGNPGVPHYSLRYWMDAFPTGVDNVCQVDIEVKYWLSFKSVR